MLSIVKPRRECRYLSVHLLFENENMLTIEVTRISKGKAKYFIEGSGAIEFTAQGNWVDVLPVLNDSLEKATADNGVAMKQYMTYERG